jgi:hypothetical protein
MCCIGKHFLLINGFLEREMPFVISWLNRLHYHGLPCLKFKIRSLSVLEKDGWISFLNFLNILYIALHYLDHFQALEFFPGDVSLLLKFLSSPSFLSIPLVVV